jgi:hypothetical protein
VHNYFSECAKGIINSGVSKEYGARIPAFRAFASVEYNNKDSSIIAGELARRRQQSLSLLNT